MTLTSDSVDLKPGVGFNLKLENQKYDASFDHSYSKNSKNTVYVTKYVKVNVHTSADFLDERSCKFYTGLSLPVFRKTCICLSQDYKIKQKGALYENDTILLFFMRLRRGLLFEDLAYRFGVSRPTATKIFQFWLPKAATVFKQLLCWRPDEVIKKFMPEPFQIAYPNTKCIIDTIEVPIAKPLPTKGQVIGDDKVKILVASAPSGYCMFVSGTFEGRASEKYIIDSSGIMDVLEPGMEVMADAAYHAELSARGVKISTSAFKRDLSTDDSTKTKNTRVRNNVKMAFARIQSFEILKKTVQLKSIDSIENIVTCCAGMANLQP